MRLCRVRVPAGTRLWQHGPMSRLALTRLAALLLAVIVALNPPLLEAAQERVADARAHLHQAGDESASDHADQHCDPTC